MSTTRTLISRSAIQARMALCPELLMPARAAVLPAMRRMSTAKSREEQEKAGIRDDGAASEFNKDGTSPNKSYIYIGGGILLLGAAFMTLTGRPDKAAEGAVKIDPTTSTRG